MTPERLYAMLLVLYPPAFRNEYGEPMMEAFRQMYRAEGASPAFWPFVLCDLSRSVCHEQIDACRSGPRRFALQWAGACACAAIVTGLLGNLLGSIVSYLYHPYLEGLALAPWSYGAFLGTGLGLAQTVVLRRRFHLGPLWVVASAVGTALGLQLAMSIARVGGAAGPVGALGHIGYGIVLGGFVSGGQWLVLRGRFRGRAWWVLPSAAAVSVAVLSCASAMRAVLRGLEPLPRDPLLFQSPGHDMAVDFLVRRLYAPASGADLAGELAVLVTCGLVAALATLRPLSLIHAHQENS